jgi:hypothetical protein
LLWDLGGDFAPKDLGHLHYFLGIEVHCTPNDLCLSQSKYTKDLLHCAGMQNCKSVTTQLSSTTKLWAHVGELLAPEYATKYRSLVGALRYLTLTRPNISFAVNEVCQDLHTPTTDHMTAVKRILQFLQHSLGMSLQIRHSASTMVSMFSNVD